MLEDILDLLEKVREVFAIDIKFRPAIIEYDKQLVVSFCYKNNWYIITLYDFDFNNIEMELEKYKKEIDLKLEK